MADTVKAAIAFSGSILAPWAITEDPGLGVRFLAGYLGCPNTTSAEAISCLRTLPYEAILNGTIAVELAVSGIASSFVPRTTAYRIRTHFNLLEY